MNQVTLDNNQWVDLYGDALFRFTLIRVKDEDLAEEIVQNTFLGALKSQESFAGNSTEKTWLFGILKNKIREHYRELQKNRKYNLQLEDDRDPCEQEFDGKGHWQALPVNWGINPQKAAENKELTEVLSKCINILSDKFRHLYVLREIEGLSTERICADLNISQSNLWVILHRCRNQLKKCFEVYLFEASPCPKP